LSKIIFVTYASGAYKKNIFWNKLFVRIFIRPDKIVFLTDEDLKNTEIYTMNKDVFDTPKGGGYWAWKPWVIFEAIKNAVEGDVVLYQDCGKGFKYKNFRKPNNLINYALQSELMPGILVPIHGKNKNWTHSKCFELMGCCDEKYYESPQVEASVSAWRVGEKSKQFVEEWFSYCLNLEVVGDLKSNDNEIKEFVQHRYDQSILTNLVIKRNMKPILLSFDDMHYSKSLSLVDLGLNKNHYLNRFVLTIILNLFRAKKFLNMNIINFFKKDR